MRGRWLGWIFLFFLFLLDSSCDSSFERRLNAKVLANLLLVDLCSEDVSLVVAVVVLLFVGEMVSELSDLRKTRRNRSRIAIVAIFGRADEGLTNLIAIQICTNIPQLRKAQRNDEIEGGCRSRTIIKGIGNLRKPGKVCNASLWGGARRNPLGFVFACMASTW